MAAKSARIVGAPFSLGGRSVDQGFDCFTLVIDHLMGSGVVINWEDRYRGHPLRKWIEAYRLDPDTFQIAVYYLQERLTEIDPVRAVAGDILLINLKKSTHPHFFAIEGGNGRAITATEQKGVVTIPKRFYNLERGFRIWAH